MLTEYDERVLDYHKMNYGNHILKKGTMKACKMKVKKITLYHYN